MLTAQVLGTNWVIIQKSKQTNKQCVCKQTNKHTASVAGFIIIFIENITYI